MITAHSCHCHKLFYNVFYRLETDIFPYNLKGLLALSTKMVAHDTSTAPAAVNKGLAHRIYHWFSPTRGSSLCFVESHAYHA